MPRKKANKPPNATSTTCPVICAKCTGCHMIGELKVCETCQYPECSSCIDKHQQEDKISQRKTKIDFLRQQTTLKYERLEKSIEKMAMSLDLLKTTEETFDRTIKAEYDAYQQKLKQSKVINQQHIDDLQHMWEDFEKMDMTSAEDCGEIDQIESSLTKKPIEFCFRPNLSTPSLGSLDEALSDPIISDVVQTKKQLSDVLASSSSSEPSVVLKFCNDNDSSSAPFIVVNSSQSVNDNSGNLKLVPEVKEQQQQQLSKSQKRRKNQKLRRADKSLASAESNISTEEVQEFAKPGTYKKLHCEGRPCANCGKCRDWQFEGNLQTWRWIQNYKDWNQDDKNRWISNKLNFKKSSGATCYYSSSAPHYFHYLHFYGLGQLGGPLSHIPGPFFDPPPGCLCDTNHES